MGYKPRRRTIYGVLVFASALFFLWHSVAARIVSENQVTITTEPVGSVFAFSYPPIDKQSFDIHTEWIRTQIFIESIRYGVRPDVADALAWFESRYKPDAKNPNSSATGIYQFINSTFESECEGEVTDAHDNIVCFMRLASEEKWSHWLADPATADVLAGFDLR